MVVAGGRIDGEREGEDVDPLVVAAVLDEPAQSRLNLLRRRHFPPERNHLDAHVTLFHALPGEQEPEVAAALATATRRTPPEVVVGEPRLLGRGVAFRIDAPGLLALRAELARTFDPWLTAQDRGKRELHVTVQNKVPPDRARALHAVLANDAPEPTAVVALGLWRYLGGPWAPLATFPLAP
ncbi:2'-5' RNA ligase family protein [Pseudonocardia sp. RS11V-5]|uniref:2'-5' RNA ligase family protein n=1 Tax=Pseudonocardia terrae TaxID=2905831 RepID=UPI001E450CFD|nr:2'-5' RNA ligase family protein [Pseudonocardia terrae]MCE3550428.1 2'-5' RNA ligase family protein [Pseudonocardia terrae]